MATPVLDKADAAGRPEPGFADSPYITVTFRVRRFNPEVSAEATWEDFQLEIDPKERVLDGLHKIKWDLDGTLTFAAADAWAVEAPVLRRVAEPDWLVEYAAGGAGEEP